MHVTGRVQGVGFRYFAEESARKSRLTGWVRNLPNGHVECEVEGPKDAIEQFVDDLRKGPPLSRVEHVQISWGSFADRFTGFEIRF